MEKIVKIIYSDIDGTLLDDNHHIPLKTRERILELDRKGIPFILVSARMPDGIRVIQKELGNRRPIICYSGGLILDENQNILYSCQIDLEIAMDVALTLDRERPNICYNTYGGNFWVVKDDQNPWVVREEQITEGKSIPGDIREIFSEMGGIHKFLLMGKPEDITDTEEFLQRRYPQLSILRSNAYYLEVMNGSVNKAAGIKYLCNHYGISTDESAAFGDGENDIEMINLVGYGFAMGNASKQVKQQVKRITLSNEEEGIRKALETIPLG